MFSNEMKKMIDSERFSFALSGMYDHFLKFFYPISLESLLKKNSDDINSLDIREMNLLNYIFQYEYAKAISPCQYAILNNKNHSLKYILKYYLHQNKNKNDDLAVLFNLLAPFDYKKSDLPINILRISFEIGSIKCYKRIFKFLQKWVQNDSSITSMSNDESNSTITYDLSYFLSDFFLFLMQQIVKPESMRQMVKPDQTQQKIIHYFQEALQYFSYFDPFFIEEDDQNVYIYCLKEKCLMKEYNILKNYCLKHRFISDEKAEILEKKYEDKSQ